MVTYQKNLELGRGWNKIVNMEKILRDYFENHLSSCKLSKKYNIHETTIQKWIKLENRKNEVLKLIKENGWNIQKARKIIRREGDRIRGLKRRKKIKLIFSSELAYMMGAVFGDGHITNSSIEFDLWDKNFAETCLRKGELAFGINGVIKERFYESRGKYFVIHFYSVELANFFKKYKKGTKNWQIPNEIMNGSIKLKCEFLKGFFDAEGHVSLSFNNKALQGYIQCCSTNFKGIKQVFKLLNNLSIGNFICKYRNEYGDYWTIYIRRNKDDIRKFSEVIGFNSKRDSIRLNFLLSNLHKVSHKWVIPENIDNTYLPPIIRRCI